MGAADMEITLVTENSKVRYVGDGARVEFAYDFNPIDLNYVKVYKNLVEVNSPDITVSPGVVTFEVAPLAGDTIVIMRDMPLTYEKGIVSKGIINSDSLDNLAVELLGQIQQVNEKLSRTPTYPLDTSLTGEEIFSEFNQNVQSVKDAKDTVNGKVEEVNSAVSSGLNEITEATSESQTAITEEKNSAISEIQSATEGLIQRAETAADEAEASAQAAATSASLAQIENKISNCITKVPDNIKLTLSNDTLTLKAGSNIYDANGLYATTAQDVSSTTAGTNRQVYIVYQKKGAIRSCLMGESVDSLPPAANTSKVYYNTTDKKCYLDKQTWEECSFPIALCTSTTEKYVSIDQVFNFWGKIGDAVFINPGIDFLYADGFNTDGSYNSLKLTTSKIIVRELTQADKNWGIVHVVFYNTNAFGFGKGYQIVENSSERGPASGAISYYYVKDENLTYVFDNANSQKFVYLGYIDVPNNKLYIRNTVKLADEQDVVKKFGDTMSGNLLIKNSYPYTQVFNTDIDRDANPSSSRYGGFQVFDKNGKQLGNFFVRQDTSGNMTTNMLVTGKNGTDRSIQVIVFADGGYSGYSPTPTNSAGQINLGVIGDEILTARWFNTKIQVVSALPSSPNANVYYFIPE